MHACCLTTSVGGTGAIHTSLHGQSVFFVPVLLIYFSVYIYTDGTFASFTGIKEFQAFYQTTVTALKMTLTKANELVKIKFIDRK